MDVTSRICRYSIHNTPLATFHGHTLFPLPRTTQELFLQSLLQELTLRQENNDFIKEKRVYGSLLTTTQFAQELLSTFSTQIGEVALIPATGGLFTVELTYASSSQQEGQNQDVDIRKVLLWDRKAEGGFPGTPSPYIFSPKAWIVKRVRLICVL